MRTRIITSYLLEEGYNEIGDRDIDLDKYLEATVKTVKQGVELIHKQSKNGIGTVTEQIEDSCGWDDIKKHNVSDGIIFQTILFS